MECIQCHSKPVDIKKWQLCKNCYQMFRTKEKINTKTASHPDHINEVQFIKNYFTHNDWFYQPAKFNLNGESYHPDFYDGETHFFIEVVGTRQAFYHGQEKYRKFIKTYPEIKFEIRLVDGQLIDIDNPQIYKKQH